MEQKFFKSKLLNRDVSYYVYLPKNYDENKSYPVLHLLHGFRYSGFSWINEEEGNAIHILDKLIEKKEIPDMIAVFVDAGPCWYVDGTEKIRSFFEKEFFTFIQESYPISSNREDHIIGGASMGGMGSTAFYLRNPKYFGKLLLMSPTYFDSVLPVFAERSQASSGDLKNQFALDYFQDYQKSGLNGDIFMIAGDKDPLVDKDNTPLVLPKSLDLYLRFVENKDNAHFRVVGGTHEWKVWRKGLKKGLKTFYQR